MSLFWGHVQEPRYVTRRLIRFASEDVGLADPNALNQEGEKLLVQCVKFFRGEVQVGKQKGWWFWLQLQCQQGFLLVSKVELNKHTFCSLFLNFREYRFCGISGCNLMKKDDKGTSFENSKNRLFFWGVKLESVEAGVGPIVYNIWG